MDKVGYGETETIKSQLVWLRTKINELIEGHNEIVEKIDNHISFEEMIRGVNKKMQAQIEKKTDKRIDK